jgi:hypothetical protein
VLVLVRLVRVALVWHFLIPCAWVWCEGVILMVALGVMVFARQSQGNLSGLFLMVVAGVVFARQSHWSNPENQLAKLRYSLAK